MEHNSIRQQARCFNSRVCAYQLKSISLPSGLPTSLYLLSRLSTAQPLSLDQHAAAEAVPRLVPGSGFQASWAVPQVEDLRQVDPDLSSNQGSEARSAFWGNIDNSASPRHDTVDQNGKPEESGDSILTAQSRQQSSEAMPSSPTHSLGPSGCVGLEGPVAVDEEVAEGHSSASEQPLRVDDGAGLEETRSQGSWGGLFTHESSKCGNNRQLGWQPASQQKGQQGWPG